ncbi:MAG TPA: sigma-70 family RNA polymerase sigma factor [Crinalium sp.]|jgi:RNA polymerase sigma-B factor
MTTAIRSVESAWASRRQRISIQERNRLATQHDKLALKIAHRMAGQCAESLDDLAQIARIGLLKAIEKFDSSKGVAFSSFAVPYIQGEIQHFLRDHWGQLKVPRRTFEKVGIIKRDHRKLQSLGRTVELDEIAAAHGVSQDDWRWMVSAVQRKPLASLDDITYHDPADLEMDEELSQGDLRQALFKELAKLPKLKRECVLEFYFEQLSEEAIARRHKLTPLEIHSLLEQAISQLQAQLRDAAQC